MRIDGNRFDGLEFRIYLEFVIWNLVLYLDFKAKGEVKQ
jgi:hypothetical protein